MNKTKLGNTLELIGYVFMILAIVAALGSMSGCAIEGPPGVTGATGAQGERGLQGPKGDRGSDGKDGVDGAAGSNGADATFELVKLCPGTPSYPSRFIEYAIRASDGKLYGVYSANNGFLTYFPPGAYQSNAVGSSCNFTITVDNQIVN